MKEMISWFKTSLENTGKLFEAPGHQRIVFPQPKNLTPAKKKRWHDQMHEVFRNIQAYIIARGILGNTGIERANFKKAFKDTDFDMRSLMGTDRGVIRFDRPGRFVPDTYSVELRAGTKDAVVQQFIEQTLTARIAAGDFEGIKGINEWVLNDQSEYRAKSLVHRFGVSTTTAERFLRNAPSGVQMSYQIALWKWENAPFMKGKINVLKWATRHYIETVAASSNPEVIRVALKKWTRAVNLEVSLREYLRPKRFVSKLENLHHHRSTGRVDVNKVDLGIEYSGRFASKYSVELTSQALSDGSKGWVHTVSDMTPYERKEALRKMAESLGRQLNGGRYVRVLDVSQAGAHGHGLSVAFKVKDAKGRSWRVEWDGVGRTYTESGQVVPESLRGGHIEIVTPKFTPAYSEMQAVFKAMAQNGIIPSRLAGGGHVNIDLAPFKGNPKALARFLTLFHQNRSMMSFLFQNMNRSAAAQPVEISPELARKLRDFNGTETELKRLLYNERYFNRRLGRKTRNVQLDMSAYFQDVIPANHIHQDFDMKNPNEPWRPQFRVDPNIRKMEFRMFDAPIDAFESAMQMKVVRALLNKALNETGTLSGEIQEVAHERYAEDYDKAQRDFEKMCRELGLEIRELKTFLVRATSQGRQNMSSRHHETYEEKVRARGWEKVRSSAWGEALTHARPSTRAIESEGRHWRGQELSEARAFRERRIRGAREGDQIRAQSEGNPSIRREIKIGVNCRSIFGL